MNIANARTSRRRFINKALSTIAALQIGTFSSTLRAAELPHLDESDPAAKALAYVHDASTVSDTVRGDGSRVCSTCRFYTEPESQWGPCTLFQGKAVAAKGWCKGWVAKA